MFMKASCLTLLLSTLVASTASADPAPSLGALADMADQARARSPGRTPGPNGHPRPSSPGNLLRPARGGRHQITILEFSAPWCAPCRIASPVLDYLEQRCPNADVAEVGDDEASQCVEDPAHDDCDRFREGWRTPRRLLSPTGGAPTDIPVGALRPFYTFNEENAGTYNRLTQGFFSGENPRYPTTVIIVDGNIVYNSHSSGGLIPHDLPEKAAGQDDASRRDQVAQWAANAANTVIPRIEAAVRTNSATSAWSCAPTSSSAAQK